MESNYYLLLEIQKDSDLSGIKAAYRRLARKYHPDVNTSQDANERFQAITTAYQTLSDPEKRKSYDTSLNCLEILEIRKQKIREKLKQQLYPDNRKTASRRKEADKAINDSEASMAEQPKEAVEDFFDNFASIFKVAFNYWKQPVTTKAKKHKKPIALFLTPKEVKAGGFKEIVVYKKAACPHCKGTKEKKHCSKCNSSSYIKLKKMITLDLPAGLEAGLTVRLPILGEAEFVWVTINYLN